MSVRLIAIDNRDAWTAATVTANPGAGAQTFTPSASVYNALQWLQEFVAWFGSAFSDTASWSFAANADHSAVIVVSVDQVYTWTASSSAQSLLGIASGASSAEFELDGAKTTWADGSRSLAFGAYRNALTWDDASSGTGASGGSSLGAGVKRPILSGLTGARGAWRLSEISRAARSPRSITIYDGSTFVAMSLGAATRQRSRPGIYRIEFEVLA